MKQFFNEYRMSSEESDSAIDKAFADGFNKALILANEKLKEELESSILALRRSYLEADAIARGTNHLFVCAPVIRDYCQSALQDLGEIPRECPNCK